MHHTIVRPSLDCLHANAAQGLILYEIGIHEKFLDFRGTNSSCAAHSGTVESRYPHQTWTGRPHGHKRFMEMSDSPSVLEIVAS